MKMRIVKFLKDFLLWSGILRLFSVFNHLFFFLRNFNLLRSWISQANRTDLLINDFYSWKRDYPKRYRLLMRSQPIMNWIKRISYIWSSVWLQAVLFSGG